MALIDHWEFEEASGPNAYSTAGNENYAGGFSGITWQATGKYDYCIQFDGTGYLNQSNGVVDNIPCDSGTRPDTFSWSAWVYITGSTGSSGNRHVICSKMIANGGFVYCATDETNGLYPYFEVWKNGTSSTTVTGDTAVTTNTWQHHAVTYEYVADGTSKIRLYLNGVLVGSTDTAVGPPSGNFNPFRIGGHDNGTVVRYLTGRLDDLRLYDHALTLAEVETLAEVPDEVVTNLVGQSASTSIGSLSVTGGSETNLSGQALTSAIDDLSATGGSEYTIIGQGLASALDDLSVAAGADLSLSGQSATISYGDLSVIGHALLSLSGQGVTAIVGDLLPTISISVDLTGQSAVISIGDLVANQSIEFTLSTQEIASAIGSLTATGSADAMLTSQVLTSALGQFGIVTNADFSIAGQSITLSQNNVLAVVNDSVELSGHAAFSSSIGTLTVVGGAAAELSSHALQSIANDAFAFLIANPELIAPSERQMIISAFNRTITVSAFDRTIVIS